MSTEFLRTYNVYEKNRKEYRSLLKKDHIQTFPKHLLDNKI